MAVTKDVGLPAIQEAMAAGISHLGENKVQEADKKYLALDSGKPNVVKHMIGHLQTNKVKAALEIFDMIQSVDSLKLAGTIDKEAAKLNRLADILVEVNTSGEVQKYGVTPPETLPLLERIAALSHIRLLGLMTVGPMTDNEEAVRRCFRKLKDLYDNAREKFQGYQNMQMKYLSMGMSADYPLALEEGSNMVRIGRAIFE